MVEEQILRKTAALLPLCLALSSTAAGSADSKKLTFAIDDSASSVTAKVGFLGLGSKTATFPTVTGSISLTPANISAIDLSVKLDATALKAGDKTTENRLKGKDFFDVTRYPAVSFTGTTLKMTGEKSGIVTGKLTAKGYTKPFSLSVSFAVPPASAAEYKSFTLNGSGVLSRKQFGMTAYKGVVGDKVTITINSKMVVR
jgi:polyisoprenoid-binding protein YceI